MKHDDPSPVHALTYLRAAQTDPRQASRLRAHYRARIESAEPHIRAWRECDAARLLTAPLAGPLAGLPLGIKDIMLTRDFPTRYGSPLYEEGSGSQDAACVATLRAAGGAVLGKTVTTEFAYFQPGPTANPHDPARTPGGSSSGSAAAVAAGMVPVAMGSQTAGSLIRPASYCGVFALKPGHGEFDLAGVKAMAPTLDTLGWLANSADDLELIRCVLAGQRFDALPEVWPADMRLAICRSHEWNLLDEDGAALIELGLDRLARAGITLREQPLPDALTGLTGAQQHVQAYEAAREFDADWRRAADRMSAPLRGLIETGQSVGADSHAAALALAARGRREVATWFEHCDALVVPSATGEAPVGLAATGDPVFCRAWTLLGLPCVNVPGLYGPHDMPFGLQLVGPRRSERRLLAMASQMQRILNEGN